MKLYMNNGELFISHYVQERDAQITMCSFLNVNSVLCGCLKEPTPKPGKWQWLKLLEDWNYQKNWSEALNHLNIQTC